MFTGHEAMIKVVKFMPEPHSVITGSEDKTLRLWDLRAADSTRTLTFDGRRVFFFAHPPISPICRTPLFPYLTFYSCLARAT